MQNSYDDKLIDSAKQMNQTVYPLHARRWYSKRESLQLNMCLY